MALRYPQPGNEDDFEEMCLRFYRKLWKNDSLTLYAKRGEKQYGVDIHDPTCVRPHRVVQCKYHETNKSFPPAEIKNEVAKAECSSLPIDEYVIATTAKKSKNAQNVVVELNQRSGKRFVVELHFWEDMCERLAGFSVIQTQFIVYGHDVRYELLATAMQDRELRLMFSNSTGGAEKATAGVFAEIEQLLLTRNFDAAAHELDKLAKDEQCREYSAANQYMLLRLRAKLALEAGQFEVASDLFLAAYDKQPDLEQAKQNRVLAYSLIQNNARAFELAKQYLASGVTTPLMLCRIIETAPTVEALEEYIDLITPHLGTDEDINIALCHKWLAFANTAGATEAGDRAVCIAPDSPHAHFAAAISHHDASITGPWRHRKTQLEAALKHYDAAVNGASVQRYKTLLPGILVNRAVVHELLGNCETASADYRSAVAAAVRPSECAAIAVSHLVHRQDYKTAKELLQYVDVSTTVGRFLQIITAFNSTEDDKERGHYANSMFQLAEVKWDRSVECRLHCVHWALLLKDLPLARSCISEDFKKTSPFQSQVALAWIAIDSGDRCAAKQHSNIALEQDVKGVHRQELRLLGDILNKLEEYEKAIDVFEHIATPGVLNDDTKTLIHCAERLERHGLLLRICRELRHTGEQDERLRRMEIQLLSRYAPDQGFALVEEFINESLSPAYFVAFRNVLAVRLGKTDIVQVDNSSLPRPADLSPRESYLVTLPFEALEMYENAMQFLYDQLRLFFDDEVAHESYVSFLLTYGGKTSFHQRPKTVLGECAVLLESQRGACRWVVIENNNPVPTRGEFAEGSGLALSMIGRAVNDVVEIPGGLSQPDTATIREIQTKYARAFQDCLDLFRERFPEARFIQRLHVGSGDEFDPTPIVASLMQRREYVEKCFEFYKKNLCSLYLLARRLGVCEFDAMTALTQQSGGLVRCCVTTPSEFQRLANMGNPDEIIVMDISAIATLTLLDAWHCLDPKRCYLVSHATKELIDHLVIRARNERSVEGGYANVDEHGRLLIQETTSEQREAQYARLNYIREMIEYHCECRSSQAVAELPREKRNVYEKVAGFHNIEAMSLAKAVKAVVWTDDLFLASIAKSEFGVPVTWTQLGLRWFVESGHLANDEFDLVSAKLASWNYEMTIWNADTIVKSAEHAQWDPQRWPFRQCIDLIDKTSLTKTEKAQMVLVCLKLLRRSSCSEMRQTSVIQMLLDALGDRRVVIWMHQQLDQVFTVDIRSAAFVRMQIEYWLQLHLV